MKKRMIAALLALALVFSLFGCQKAPVEEAQPTEPTVPAPDPAQVYSEARAALEDKAAVTLDVTRVMTTTVEDQSFVQESEQVLTYSGLDTEAPVILLEEELSYNLTLQEDTDEEAEESEEKTSLYTEIYTDGTLYVELEDEAAFSGSLSAEESAARYIPVALMDAALYTELNLETAGDKTTISFEAPTAPEAWVMPEDAQMLEASGSAVIGADGAMEQMNYAITYQYGAAQICLEVESKPRAQAQTVTVPEDTQRYSPIDHIDALKLTINTENLLKDTKSVRLNKTESITSEAAGMAYENGATIELYDENELLTKTENRIFVSDPASGSVSGTTVQTYKDGSLTIEVDGGVPTTQSGVKDEDMREFCQLQLSLNVAQPSFWENVTVEDLGSTYYFEYDYTENYGNNIQNTICLLLFSDMTILNGMASNYVTEDISGYMAIDKYTGLVTASGMNYAGIHTIDGDDYLLSMQLDQGVEMPAYGVYEEITGNAQAEEEPEEKATPLFYHVTGAEGQEMWLLGTIHVGDERTAYLPQEIYDALAASDALALEMDQDAFETQLEEDEKLAEKVGRAYYYSDGSTVEEHLDEQLYASALKQMKASGNYDASAQYMKTYVWQSAIENFYLQQGHQLHSEQGVEERLTKLAKEQDKPIREIESGLFQIQMLTGWSEELQQLLLEDTLSYGAEEYWTQSYELYELWCAGDEEALRQELSEEEDLSELTEEELEQYNAHKHLFEEYDKAMSYDRNEDMLDVAIDYLESGEVIFYAVGLAHLLDNVNGLVDALREAGYSVELVTYYQ